MQGYTFLHKQIVYADGEILVYVWVKENTSTGSQ